MKSIPTILISALLLGGCSKESSPVAPAVDPEIQNAYTQVVTLQEAGWTTFQNLLLAQVDTLQALDSIATLFRADTSVVSAVAGDEGISVEYRNGLRGGFDLENDAEGDSELRKPQYSGARMRAGPLQISPSSKKTIFLVSHYSSRKVFADALIAVYNDAFPKAGYLRPEVYKDGQVTLERLSSLSGYGVIHIYSHGWAFPSANSPNKEIYLQTGEVPSLASTVKYWPDMRAGRMALVRHGPTSNRYYVSPAFLTRGAPCTDTALVYGGFCYSFLGSWPETILSWGAGAYLGVDWSVRTGRNVNWANGLFAHLTDTTAAQPWSVGEWYQNGTPIAKWYNNGKRIVTLQRAGRADLTLWKRSSYRYLYLALVMPVDYQVTDTHTQHDTLWTDMLFTLSQEAEGGGAGTIFRVDSVITPYIGLTDTMHVDIELDAKSPTVLRKITAWRWGAQSNTRVGWKVVGHGLPVIASAPGAFVAKVSGTSCATYVDTLEAQHFIGNGSYLQRATRYWANDLSIFQVTLSETPLILSMAPVRRAEIIPNYDFK